MITTDYFGVKTGAFTYDPFGNQLNATTPPQNNSTPGTSKGYLGQFHRLTENDFAVPVINMGDRVYLPGLGRFAQPDPVEGGNANAYIYPADPVNARDTDGNFVWFAPVAWFVVRAVVTAVVLHYVAKAIQKVVPPPYREPAQTAISIVSFASPGGAAKNAASKTPQYVPKVVKKVKDVFGGSNFKYQPEKGWRGTTMDTQTSLKYHYKAHGAGRSETQYFEDAQNFAKNPTGKRQTAIQLKDGTKGVKYRTKGSPGGIIDEHGNIISFWYD